MIFKQIDEILNGTKTQTRRVVKEGQVFADSPWKEVAEDKVEFLTRGVYKVIGLDEEDDNGTVEDMHLIYGIDRTYSVVAKRGRPAVWWRVRDGKHETITTRVARYLAREHAYIGEIKDGVSIPLHLMKPDAEFMREFGWQEMRIRITDIDKEPLQDITEADARAEGVASVAAYRDLWESINGRTPGARWADNPAVWVITFELVR